MNPPYNHGLGNKFLEKVLDISNKIVTVQPVTWLVTKKQSKKITQKVDNSDSYIEIINPNDSFDGIFMRDIAIQYIDTTKKGKIHIYGNEYDKCEDVKLWSNDNFLEQFIEKILPVNNSLWDNIKGTAKKVHNYEPYPNPDWYCVRIPKIKGKGNAGDKKHVGFYAIISNDDNYVYKGKYKDIMTVPNRKGSIEFLYCAFDTKNELHNFINYIKTDFVRTCLMLLKKDQHLNSGELKYIPWQDFTNPVFARSPKQIDDYLFKKYNISNDIRQHIEEILPDYYGIR